MAKMMDRAVEGFQGMIKDKVQWCAHKIWTPKILGCLEEINKIIVSAKRMGVTQAETIPNNVIDALIPVIADMRTLGMEDDIKALLGNVLIKCGVDRKDLKFEMNIKFEDTEVPGSIMGAWERANALSLAHVHTDLESGRNCTAAPSA